MFMEGKKIFGDKMMVEIKKCPEVEIMIIGEEDKICPEAEIMITREEEEEKEVEIMIIGEKMNKW